MSDFFCAIQNHSVILPGPWYRSGRLLRWEEQGGLHHSCGTHVGRLAHPLCVPLPGHLLPLCLLPLPVLVHEGLHLQPHQQRVWVPWEDGVPVLSLGLIKEYYTNFLDGLKTTEAGSSW